MGVWQCIYCERPTDGKPCECPDAIEDRAKRSADFQKSGRATYVGTFTQGTDFQKSDRMTMISAMCEVADALLAGGVPRAMAKLEEIGKRIPCRTPKCVCVLGHYGPCSDGVNIIETKQWTSKVRKKGQP